MSEQKLRRKAAAAKSLLSRLENQRYEAGRSGADMKTLNAMQDKVDAQNVLPTIASAVMNVGTKCYDH
jgi:hypothetical protein